MTTQIEELVKQLRSRKAVKYSPLQGCEDVPDIDCINAADALEALAAESTKDKARIVELKKSFQKVTAINTDQAIIICRIEKKRLDANDRIAELEAKVAAFREAAMPFAEIVEHDIGVDETDQDVFRPMTSGHNLAPLLRVGDLRAIYNALMSALQMTEPAKP